MPSNGDDDDRYLPKQVIIPPGEHELDTFRTSPGVIRNAFITAIQLGIQGRAAAAYKDLTHEVVGAVQELRALDEAIAARKQSQLILEHFDKYVAAPDHDRLTARAAEAEIARIEAQTKLYKAKLQGEEERAAADARHREAVGKSQGQPAHKTPDAFDPNNLSPEEYELSERIDANARRAASGHAGKKMTARDIYALRDMLKARHPEDAAYCADVDAAAEEAIKDLGLDDDDDDVIYL